MTKKVGKSLTKRHFKDFRENFVEIKDINKRKTDRFI
jgi:hypothetical protein